MSFSNLGILFLRPDVPNASSISPRFFFRLLIPIRNGLFAFRP